MSTRKSFVIGEVVEIRREPGYTVPWERAEYVGDPKDDWRYHQVRLMLGAKPRYIDSMTGLETNADNPRAYKSRTLWVPSVRIRKAKVAP